jgi:transcription elongation factor GreA
MINLKKAMTQYFTREGLQKIKDELKDIKENQVRETKKLIKEAAAFGDLKENAAYHDARDKMSFLKGRVEQLECAINEAVIREKEGNDTIQIGSEIKILFGGSEENYIVTSPTEADILKNKISYQSPLGKELMSKKAGEKFKFNGKTEIKILEIK